MLRLLRQSADFGRLPDHEKIRANPPKHETSDPSSVPKSSARSVRARRSRKTQVEELDNVARKYVESNKRWNTGVSDLAKASYESLRAARNMHAQYRRRWGDDRDWPFSSSKISDMLDRSGSWSPVPSRGSSLITGPPTAPSRPRASSAKSRHTLSSIPEEERRRRSKTTELSG